MPSLSLEDVTSSAVAAAAARVARASSIALIAFGPFVAVVIRALSAVLLSYELLLPPLSSLLLLSSPEVCHHLFSSPLVQDNGLDPIVEPKILLDGDHPIERTLEVAEKVWSEVFFYLAQNNVIFEGILLKPSMVTPGAEHKEKASPETIAKYTLTMLRRRVPPAVPGIMKPVEVNAETKQDLRSFKLILEYIKALPIPMVELIRGSNNNAFQMQAEIQLLSPLVPVRQLGFLRLLVHHGHPLLLGSLITWVEHSQYDESLIHQLYWPLIAVEKSNGNKDAMDLEIRSRGNVVQEEFMHIWLIDADSCPFFEKEFS
ncbi:Fructose-bisphosphate aldolase [Arachis hypogaea]|nr:Fructose-bisphosphate aldolase [Arachis hypogaea]